MQNLLEHPSSNVMRSIGAALSAIVKAAPIPAAHSRGLPHAIRDLSALLTEDRSAMHRPYWASKNLFSAYVHYFLPWNLYRLAWLFPTLPIPLQKGSVVADLGSGPLTLPLALWCARPDLRGMPLRFICTDIANQPLEQGLAIFNTLTSGNSPWEIECVRAPIESAVAKLPSGVDCIMAGNVLNELQPAKGQTLQERIGGVVHACSRKLSAEGRMLFVEPGTRLGGKVITLAREAGRDLGLPILAPCSHQEACPLCRGGEDPQQRERRQFMRGGQIASQSNMWCHFSFPVEGAPSRLTRLTAAAKFDRRNLALSCIMLGAGEKISAKEATLLTEFDDLEALYAETMEEDGHAIPHGEASRGTSAKREPHKGYTTSDVLVDEKPSQPLWARIISGPIRLPDETIPARYACSAEGLVLVRRCGRIPYGGAVEVTWQDRVRDEKSGALLVDLCHEETPWNESEKGGAKRPERRNTPRGTSPKRPTGGREGRRTPDGQKVHRGRDADKEFGREFGKEASRGAAKESGREFGRKDADERGKESRSGRFGTSSRTENAEGGRPKGKGRSRQDSRFSDPRNPVKRTSDKALSRSGRTRRNEPEATDSVGSLNSYFSRPQKMRERYGKFPETANTKPEEKSSRKRDDHKHKKPRHAKREDSQGTEE